jgi:hypothetical protein
VKTDLFGAAEHTERQLRVPDADSLALRQLHFANASVPEIRLLIIPGVDDGCARSRFATASPMPT